MDLNAAAPAPAADEVLPSAADTTNASEDRSALMAAYDRITAEPEAAPEPETAPQAPEQPEAEKPATEAPSEAVEVPSDLPAGVKAAWKDLPPEARDAVAQSHREMGRKLAEQGRLVQGISPIKDALTTAIKDLPHMAGMRPEEVARDVFELAKLSHQFSAKPVETMMGLIKQHGLGQAIQQALGGQPITADAQITAALQSEIKTLKTQLARVASPDFIREQVSQFTEQDRVLGDVQTFAATAPHWAELEPHLPKFVPIAQDQLGPGASAKDVLKRAYDHALSIYLPDAQAKQQAATQAAPVADPSRAEAVRKAKSVNVSGAPGGQRELTERQALEAAYDRVMRK